MTTVPRLRRPAPASSSSRAAALTLVSTGAPFADADPCPGRSSATPAARSCSTRRPVCTRPGCTPTRRPGDDRRGHRRQPDLVLFTPPLDVDKTPENTTVQPRQLTDVGPAEDQQRHRKPAGPHRGRSAARRHPVRPASPTPGPAGVHGGMVEPAGRVPGAAGAETRRPPTRTTRPALGCCAGRSPAGHAPERLGERSSSTTRWSPASRRARRWRTRWARLPRWTTSSAAIRTTAGHRR